ncbi:hypothetical protein KO527_20605 [Pseudoalteromonas sp. C2R02]|uniref:hypothetical protein n=1 Tax=Pseudoalteromonas sp. C2R02 TaxID=2841565 RepID=UPI001C092068|nr:hypothetical protein [Pseudoalteromonas sp. C2R02]MBU2971755.1 hypothetical protein [Pseudoalteromonas sp. C2R02]
MNSTLFFLKKSIYYKTKFYALLCYIVLSLLSTFLLISTITGYDSVNQWLGDSEVTEVMKNVIWACAVMLFFILQEIMQFQGKKTILKFSVMYEVKLYNIIIAKKDMLNAETSTSLLKALKTDVPCMLRGFRALLTCLSPLLMIIAVIIYLYILIPVFVLILCVAFIVFISLQIIMLKKGEELGREFNRVNLKRARVFTFHVNNTGNDLNCINDAISDYKSGFLNRMLSIEFNRLFSTASVFFVIIVFSIFSVVVIGPNDFFQILKENIIILFLSLITVTQISTIGSSLSTYFLMRENFEDLYQVFISLKLTEGMNKSG